jgi:peroxiredoxin
MVRITTGGAQGAPLAPPGSSPEPLAVLADLPHRASAGKDPPVAVEIGDEAPDFELPDQHGTPVRLSSFRGAKNVVLVFYPLAFSPVCSGELCALREDFPEVSSEDVELLTVSVDSMFTHRAWAEAENFQFGLLADFWPHGAVATAYGVFNEEKGLAIRGTFIIDTCGVVRWKVVNPIPEARDISDYSKALAQLA